MIVARTFLLARIVVKLAGSMEKIAGLAEATHRKYSSSVRLSSKHTLLSSISNLHHPEYRSRNQTLQSQRSAANLYDIMAPNQWESEHDKSLLLLLLGLDVEISRARFDEVAMKMTNGVSGNACRSV